MADINRWRQSFEEEANTCVDRLREAINQADITRLVAQFAEWRQIDRDENAQLRHHLEELLKLNRQLRQLNLDQLGSEAFRKLEDHIVDMHRLFEDLFQTSSQSIADVKEQLHTLRHEHVVDLGSVAQTSAHLAGVAATSCLEKVERMYEESSRDVERHWAMIDTHLTHLEDKLDEVDLHVGAHPVHRTSRKSLRTSHFQHDREEREELRRSVHERRSLHESAIAPPMASEKPSDKVPRTDVPHRPTFAKLGTQGFALKGATAEEGPQGAAATAVQRLAEAAADKAAEKAVSELVERFNLQKNSAGTDGPGVGETLKTLMRGVQRIEDKLGKTLMECQGTQMSLRDFAQTTWTSQGETRTILLETQSSVEKLSGQSNPNSKITKELKSMVTSLEQRMQEKDEQLSSKIVDSGVELLKNIINIESRGNISVNMRNGDVEILKPVEFKPVKVTETPAARFLNEQHAERCIRDISDVAKLFSNVPVMVEGHTKTNPNGSQSFWESLAHNRAEIAYSKLVENGVEPERVKYRGFVGKEGQNRACVTIHLDIFPDID